MSKRTKCKVRKECSSAPVRRQMMRRENQCTRGICAQITLALDNLETPLRESGLGFQDIVRLNIYTTDVDQFFEHYDAFITRLAEAGCRHTGSLIGVTRLAFPEMMIELEATAVV